MLLVIFLVCDNAFAQEAGTKSTGMGTYVLGALLFGWMIFYMVKFSMANKIDIKDDELNVSFADRSGGSKFTPKVIKASIKLKDIKSVRLAKGQLFLGDKTSLLFKYSVFMQIVRKEGEPFLIDTTNFSKKIFRNLIKVFQDKGIPVEIEPGIL